MLGTLEGSRRVGSEQTSFYPFGFWNLGNCGGLSRVHTEILSAFPAFLANCEKEYNYISLDRELKKKSLPTLALPSCEPHAKI